MFLFWNPFGFWSHQRQFVGVLQLLHHASGMQTFGGKLATKKLHDVTRHLADQLRCQGPGAHHLELWIERMVGYLKRRVRSRVRQHPELTFVNDHLLWLAALRCLLEEPEHCTPIAQAAKSVRAMEYPSYDDGSDPEGAILLLGTRAERSGHPSGEVSAEEAKLVLEWLPTLLKDGAEWYAERGWPQLSDITLGDMLDDGELLVQKFMRATLPSADIVACEQYQAQPTCDDRWMYITYTLADGTREQCAAQAQTFLRIEYRHAGMPYFPQHTEVEAPPSAAELARKGRPARVLRLALVKLWKLDVCDAGTVGCRTDADPVTGELPDLYKISNVSEAATNLRPKKGAHCDERKRYFGDWLVNLAAVATQLVPTRKVMEGGKQALYLMTAHKASGRL